MGKRFLNKPATYPVAGFLHSADLIAPSNRAGLLVGSRINRVQLGWLTSVSAPHAYALALRILGEPT